MLLLITTLRLRERRTCLLLYFVHSAGFYMLQPVIPSILLAPPAAPLAVPTTILPPCLTAVLPKLKRSKAAGVGVNLARLCVNTDVGDIGETMLVEILVVMASAEIGSTGAALRFFRTTGMSVNPERKTSFAIRTGSRSNEVRLSPSMISVPPDPPSSAPGGIARRDKMFPTDAVTYDQLADPAAVVSQKIFQSTLTTPQATFIPLQGTKPIARMINNRRQTEPEDSPPMGVEAGFGETTIGVIFSVVISCDSADGLGIWFGARAARTRARGLGKRTAMRGARGRERR